MNKRMRKKREDTFRRGVEAFDAMLCGEAIGRMKEQVSRDYPERGIQAGTGGLLREFFYADLMGRIPCL